MTGSSDKKRKSRVTKEPKVKHYCPVCGCLMDPDGSIHNGSAETKDHIYPKSCYTGIPTYQIICRKCNSLKGSLPPSEITYRAIQFMRIIETEYSGLSPRNIQVYTPTKTETVVVMLFKPTAELRISLPDYEIHWSSYSVHATVFISVNKSKLDKLVRKIFYGPLAKRVKVNIPIL